MIFNDRDHASQLLADSLQAYRAQENTLIVGLPRGGVPIAVGLSERLEVPWTMLLVRKLGCPTNPELAFGAVAADGTCYFNEEIIDLAGVSADWVEEVKQREMLEIARRKALYQLPDVSFANKTLIVTDDGVATGATINVALNFLQQYPLAALVVAVPVIARSSYSKLTAKVDDVVAVMIPDDLSAIGQYYADFSQLGDADMQAFIRG